MRIFNLSPVLDKAEFDEDYGFKGEDPYFEIFAKGTINADPEDMCDPRVDTTVLQFRKDFYGVLVGEAMLLNISVEKAAENMLRSYMAPPAFCHHDWDCCGCRTGVLEVQHVGGAMFMTRSVTSRNY